MTPRSFGQGFYLFMALSTVVALTFLSVYEARGVADTELLTMDATETVVPKATVLERREQLPNFDYTAKIELFHLTRHDERPIFPGLKDSSGTTLTFHSSRVGLGIRKTASRYDNSEDDAEGKSEATIFFGPGLREPDGDLENRALFPGGDGDFPAVNSSGNVFTMPAVTSTSWDESTFMGVCNGITFDFLAEWMLSYSRNFCHRTQDMNVEVLGEQKRRESEAGPPSHVSIVSNAVVPSCTSHDFVYRAYEYLAYLGLAMRPLLPPKQVVISYNLAVPATLPAVDWKALQSLQESELPPLNPSFFGSRSTKGVQEGDEPSGEEAALKPISWVYAGEKNLTEWDLSALRNQHVDVVPRDYVQEWFQNLSSCVGPHLQGIRTIRVPTVATFLSNKCIPALPGHPVYKGEGSLEQTSEKAREAFVYLDGQFYLRLAVGTPALVAEESRMELPSAQPLPFDESSRTGDWVAAVILVLFFLASLSAVLFRLGVCGYAYIDAETIRLSTLTSRPDQTFFRDLVIHSPGFGLRHASKRMELELQSRNNSKESDVEIATTSELESLVLS